MLVPLVPREIVVWLATLERTEDLALFAVHLVSLAPKVTKETLAQLVQWA
jgi:hypothetical protein